MNGISRVESGTAAVAAEHWPAALERVLGDRSQPRLVFQPIVDLRRATVVGYETLARFDGPPHASPDVWFARAVEAGIGPELEARVIQAALSERNVLPPDTFLTVNVTPSHLLTPPVAGVLAAAGSLDRLVLELTEQQAILEPERLTRVLRAYRQAGAFVAVDDAGAGYAGLQALLTVRPQFIKLDRSLAGDLDREPAKLELASLLGAFASEIDAWVLAEGIERSEELEELMRLGVPLAQGYLLGRPQRTWTQHLPPGVSRMIHAMNASLTVPGQVAALVESANTVDESEPVSPTPPAQHRAAVVLDHRGRPQAIRTPHGDADATELLLVKPTESVRQVGRRMAARDLGQRFVPAVCCDDAGRYAGIVTVERVLAALSG